MESLCDEAGQSESKASAPESPPCSLVSVTVWGLVCEPLGREVDGVAVIWF